MSGAPATRRDVLRAAGALVVMLAVPLPAGAAAAKPGAPRSLRPDRLASWLAVGRDGGVTVYTGKVDMGVGVETAFAQIVADELDVQVARVEMIMGDTALTPDQGKSTASEGITLGVQPLRVAAAEARRMLVDLAAAQLGVAAGALETADGIVFVRDAPSRYVAYGDLIGAEPLERTLVVARETSYGPLLKPDAPLRSYRERTAVGTPVPRRDVPAKVAGVFPFVHNVRVPGMLHGRVVRPPAFGARLLSVDESSIATIPGARVVRRADFVGVVAPREADAIAAAAALKATWSAGTPLPAQPALYDALEAGPVLGQTDVLKTGDVDGALAAARTRIAARYRFPYQLHGMLGPSCAVADVRADRATIWSGTQWPHGTRDDLAKMLGLPAERVRLVWREASGSYGRLGCDDAAADAAVLSAAVGRPVRVQWMRYDEHGWEPISPAVAMSLEAALDANGKIAAFSLVQHAMSTAVAEAGATVAWRLLGTAPGGKRLAGFPEDSPYDVAAQRFRVVHVGGPFRTLFMRAPGIQQSAFGIEAFVDELAEAAGANPVDFRLRHLADARDRAVLNAALALARWDGTPSPSRGASDAVLRGRGVAHVRWAADGTRVAAIAEVAVDRSSGAVRVTRLSLAADCGLIINPDGLRNQLEGASLQGISRSLHEEVVFDARGVTSLDWRSYPILRFSELPEVEITLVDRPDVAPSGAGEAGTVPITAALANAIHDATGKRIREAPFTPARVRALFA